MDGYCDQDDLCFLKMAMLYPEYAQVKLLPSVWEGREQVVKGGFSDAPWSPPCKWLSSRKPRLYLALSIHPWATEKGWHVPLRCPSWTSSPGNTQLWISLQKHNTGCSFSGPPQKNVLPKPTIGCSWKAIFYLGSERCHARVALAKFLRTTKPCLVPPAFRLRTII